MLLSNNLLIFGFGPQLRFELNRRSPLYYHTWTVLNSLLLTGLIFLCSHVMMFYYLGLVMFIVLGVPLLFIYAYSFKNDVRGPWDLPKVRDYSHLD